MNNAEEVDQVLDDSFCKSSVTIGAKTNWVSGKVADDSRKDKTLLFQHNSFRRA